MPTIHSAYWTKETKIQETTLEKDDKRDWVGIQRPEEKREKKQDSSVQ
jgi:hypothetical protein